MPHVEKKENERPTSPEVADMQRRFKPRGVSFDTFANPDANINSRSKIGIDQSLTLRDEHKDYVYTRRSRTFLCGYDTKPYSEYALEWLVDELADDGDEIVCLRVIERDDKLASGASIEEHRYREVAEETLSAIKTKNTENKALSLVMELTVGKVEEQIEHMVSQRTAWSSLGLRPPSRVPAFSSPPARLIVLFERRSQTQVLSEYPRSRSTNRPSSLLARRVVPSPVSKP